MYQVIYDYLTPNPYSRPQKPLVKIKGIIIHWVANPNTSAKFNRNFFEGKKNVGNQTYGSAHEIIENETVLICVPENEVTYNCGSKTYTDLCLKKLGNAPNYCTYAIECTHINWDGVMSPLTYNTLLNRCVDLCKRFNLTANDIYLHQEIVGWKDCHKFFVKYPNEWMVFKQNVYNLLNPPKPVEEVVKVFKDFDTISEWAKLSVKKLAELQVLKGDESGNFNPRTPITREELAVTLDAFLQIMEDKK
jgi:N-acetylmuramoyl-L-alanine amidase CwlA